MNLLSEEDQAEFEVESLIIRLNRGMPADWQPDEPLKTRGRKVRFVLDMGIEIADQVVLIIRTGKDGVMRGIVAVPAYFDLPETEEGPYRIKEALKHAKHYALGYGTGRVIVDIESSQLWDKKWGELEMPSEDDFPLLPATD